MNYSDSIKRLNTEIVFILAPFIVLFIINFIDGDIYKIIYSKDWSLSASIILCQAQGKIIHYGLNNKSNQNNESHALFHSLRALLIFISIATYAKASDYSEPNIRITVLQFIEFSFAIFFHYRDGLTTLLKK